MSDLSALRDQMRAFSDERGWSEYHDPKSLILALAGELGELSELFQWVPAGDAARLARDGALHARAAEEMADVLLYLVRLADVLEIDLGAIAEVKLERAGRKYRPGDHPDRYRSGLRDPQERLT